MNSNGPKAYAPAARNIYTAIRFGKYHLSIHDEDSIWLENTDGEGMQIYNNDVFELLDAYFTKHF